VWQYDPLTRSSSESTALLALALDGSSSTLHSIGKVDGYALNSHAFDILGDTLRIATSIRNAWQIFQGPFEPVDDVEIAPEEFIAIEPESRTENYVLLMEMRGVEGEGGVMNEVGRLKLGKPNEIFTAVRFFDNIAYAVTFERTDPYYVLDLSDPTDPQVVAELEINGFSSYLHSINGDNTMILAIGEDADDDGIVLGLQITIFDSTDPTNPVAVQRHNIEKEPNTYSGSESLWDFKATRYAAGRLIMPVDIRSYENPDQDFRGFLVLVANEELIEEGCRISHGEENDETAVDRCYYCSSLPRRSFIFAGNLMTTQGQSILSTDMDTCENVWTQTILLGDEDSGCCPFYLF
jgi:hypothetical protein